MPAELAKLTHPGVFIRDKVIPKGMSVKDAASRLGVGRPALSNLLNGNASLSSEMAVRLEKAFGADQQALLELQAQFDQRRRLEEEKVVAVRAYVPSFLTIKARDIEGWAENNIEARQQLPVLLRKLIQSTGHELRVVDFPGYDNAERKGWDGQIEASAATPWIPEGRSGWEFGTDKSPGSKAEKDYTRRLASVPAAERANSTFVFVTPRNWDGKKDWARKKNASGEWKAVRAFDASDLEQWLEESISAPVWLAEKLNLPVDGFETLDECWQRWADASEPRMTRAMFEPWIAAHQTAFANWLKNPPERPFIIAADSKDEALAFLAQLFQEITIDPRWKDLAVVFESAQTLRKLASSSSPFIPIVRAAEPERELAALYRRLHCIIVHPRNAVDSNPDIALEQLGREAYAKGLAAMGIVGDDVDRLIGESGHSPTILRRRLSRIPAIRTPVWATDSETARSLIPMVLVGTWHATSSADCEVISALADRPYPEVEQSVASLLRFDDCPVWSVSHYRGVASKIDALFAVNAWITEKDLKDYFEIAENVLSESDPALDLPEDKRWAAGLYGKVRNHSAALRVGICETLVILSVHGSTLFRDRISVDVDAQISLLIRRLLNPLSLDRLLSHDNDLPRYAEAAPEAFLQLLEEDLRQSEPVILQLLRPADSGFFSGCPRSNLLWALECLAWRPKSLSRVCAILAQLSRTKIADNWSNKPIESLAAIFHAWMPQTAASLDERVKALRGMTNRFSDIGWQICIAQFDPRPQTGEYSYRPRWRSDAFGAGQVLTNDEEIEAFTRVALDIALAWPQPDERTLGDLIERLRGMSAQDQITVWNLIDAWSEAQAGDVAKADLRERIRRFAFTRRGRRRDLSDVTRDRAREAYAKLGPHDLVIRHAWLFANQWLDESADEIEDDGYDYTKRDERVDKLRSEALREIWAERGFEGVEALLSICGAPHTVGQYAALHGQSLKESIEFVRRSLAIDGDLKRKADLCILGFLQTVDADTRTALLKTVADGTSGEQIVRLFGCAPFGESTWRLLDHYGESVRDDYWQQVFPYWARHNDVERVELIDRLLKANRPRAAFHAVHIDWPKIGTSQLKRLLVAVATSNAETAGSFPVSAHDISDAVRSLDGRAGVSPDEMARLEFLFIRALDRSEHGIPNLERQIAQSPAVFVQALALAFRRNDHGVDPVEWRIDEPERHAAVASAARDLLDQIRRIPGSDRDGKIKMEALLAWVIEVRRLCAQHGRAEIGDERIGQLLSKSPADDSGMWPCLEVCEVMERVASQHIAEGFGIGVYNARGSSWRGEGGAQERVLSTKYRRWAQQVAFDYPYVGSVLESVASTYDHEAERHDLEAKVTRRLRR